MSETSASVITSENSAEFYAQKLGLAQAEPKTEAVVEETEPVEESQGSEPEAKEEAQTQDEPKKQNPRLEKRFSEITRQREEARKEAEQERQKRLELEQRLQNLEKQAQPQSAPEEDREPQPSQFQDAFEYAKALAEYTTDKRIEAMKQEEAQLKAQEQAKRVMDSWNAKLEKAKADLPNFEEIVISSDVPVNNVLRDAIMESDVGPQILYHLAENAEYGRKVANMTPIQIVKEIGKLEARFEAKAEDKPVVRSKAPAPVTPIRGATGVAETKLDSDGKWYGSYAEWKAARKSGKVR